MHLFTLVLVPSETEDVLGEVSRLLRPYGERMEEVPCPCQTSSQSVPCDRCNGSGALIMNTNFENTKWDWWMVGWQFDGWVRNEPPERSKRFSRHFDDSAKEPETRDDGTVVVELRDPEAYWAGFRRIYNDMIAANVMRVRELPADLSCFAVVTPDGQWHDSGDWTASPGPAVLEQWNAKRRALLAEHADCLAVGCDLHYLPSCLCWPATEEGEAMAGRTSVAVLSDVLWTPEVRQRGAVGLPSAWPAV